MINYYVGKKTLHFLEEKPTKFFAVPATQGVISLKELAELASDRNHASPEDVQHIILAIVNVMRREIANGRSISLGDFGSFRVSISSTGETEAAKVSAANISKLRIIFNPGKDLKNALSRATFAKVAAPLGSSIADTGGGSTEEPGELE